MNDESVGAERRSDRTATRRCGRCGASLGRENGAVLHAAFDPLEVRECRRCGAVVSVGGHRW